MRFRLLSILMVFAIFIAIPIESQAKDFGIGKQISSAQILAPASAHRDAKASWFLDRQAQLRYRSLRYRQTTMRQKPTGARQSAHIPRVKSWKLSWHQHSLIHKRHRATVPLPRSATNDKQ